MSEGSWVVAYCFGEGDIDPGLTGLVERLVVADDGEMAERLASLIELRVAPPRGGVGRGAGAVVRAVSACLPSMASSAKPAALALLGQIGGSLLAAGATVDQEMARGLVTALPFFAMAAQLGDGDLQAEFVDFVALCAALDASVASEASYYLRRVVADIGGDVGAAAEVELHQLPSNE